MNPRTQYYIIGGSTGAFILALIILFLPQTPDEPLPVTPTAEQIISNQTDNNEGNNQADSNVEEPSLPPEEEIPIQDSATVTTVPSQVSNLRSFRSGGGGNGGSSNDDNGENGDFSYRLQLFEGDQESDGTIDLGQNIKAVVSTDDNSVDTVIFSWVDPTNSIVETQTVPISSGSSEASFQPDKLGTWVVEADFGNGKVVTETLEISFLVIPESPIGVLALVAASIATIGAYALIRRRSTWNLS